jgi:A1 cistron-splicing factor AAR2
MKGVLLTEITGKAWNEWQVSSNHDYKRHSSTAADPKSSLEFEKDEVLAFIFPKDSRTFSTESHGRERTEQAMDTSSHIDAIVSGRCKFEDSDLIVGEMQFCFVTGLLLGNHACMEQWAHITKTVFKAYRYAVLNPDFFEKFITAFHSQLMYDEGAFPDESILDIDPNLRDDLKVILTIFKSRLTEQLLAQGNSITNLQKAVGEAFEKLESWLWKWGWDLRGNYVRKGNYQLEDGTVIQDLEISDLEAEDERGEYAAQVVELDEDGREIGLISF